jgi:hypothetical protein
LIYSHEEIRSGGGWGCLFIKILIIFYVNPCETIGPEIREIKVIYKNTESYLLFVGLK